MHTRQIYCKTPSKFQNVSWMNQTLSGQPMPQTSVLSFTIKWVQSRTYFWGSFKWWNELIQCLIHGKHSMCVLVTQSCPTLQPHGNPPGSSVHGILQARILEWVLCPPSGDLPDPGIEPMSLMSPSLAGGFLTTSATWEAFICWEGKLMT